MRLALAFLLSCSLFASEPWSTKDKVLEGAFVASMFVDYRQTSNLHCDGFHEQNSIMGKHPEQSTINTYFLASTLLHIYISDKLSGNYRTAWQCTWVAAEIGTVERNYRLGIRFNF